MNQQIHTLIITSSYLISKALIEIIPNYFNKLEILDKCEDFDILLNKIEKNNFTVIFTDESIFSKFEDKEDTSIPFANGYVEYKEWKFSWINGQGTVHRIELNRSKMRDESIKKIINE